MKKIIAMLLVVLMAVALFSGCTAKEIPAEIGDLPIANVGETVPEETETPTEAETITEAETATETTSETKTNSTSKNSKTTTKTETTSKKSETTTQKSTTTNTSHSHDWKAHYAERKVLVKEAWDEPDYWVDKYHTHVSGLECKDCGKKFGLTCEVCGYFYAYEDDEHREMNLKYGGDVFVEGYGQTTDDIGKSPTGNNAGEDAAKHKAETGHNYIRTGLTIAYIDLGYYAKGKHHDAEYKTEKYIDYYYCSCGAKKNA